MMTFSEWLKLVPEEERSGLCQMALKQIPLQEIAKFAADSPTLLALIDLERWE